MLLLGGCAPKPKPKAVDGTLDLTSWDFASDGPVALSGQWSFYPNRLLKPEELQAKDVPPPGTIKVPGIWNGAVVGDARLSGLGHGTYRLRLLLPPHEEQLALRFQTFGTAFTAYGNGRVISSVGVPGDSRSTSEPEWRPHVAVLAPQTSGELDLVLEASNYHHRKGGAFGAVSLGNASHQQSGRTKTIALEVLLAGAILVMGLYHLVLFAVRRDDRSPMYFGLMCLLLSTYTLLSGERYFAELVPMGWHGRVRLTNLTSFLAVPAFLAFIASLFPRELRGSLLVGIQGAVVALALAVLVTPSWIYSFLIPIFHVLTLAACSLVLIALVRAALFCRQGARTLLAGFFLMSIATTNDVLFDQGLVNTGQFVGLGVFLFIGFLTYVLARRFGAAFDTVETQRAELEQANVQQTREISERVKTQRALAASEARYRTMVDNVPDLIYTLDSDGRCSSINEFGQNLLGFSDALLVGRHFSELVHPDDVERVAAIFDRAIEEKRWSARTERFRLLDHRDNILWVSSNTTAVFDENGDFISFLGAIQNISEERELEERLIQVQRMEAIGT
ncbi:MAG: PAS domain S-box protein [Proteobacteria bacterium]|nr:PAS domain S-box protein [Pseudomonadota bacterium]